MCGIIPYEELEHAYELLKEIVPDHELCQLYEAGWSRDGPNIGIAARFPISDNPISAFVDAIQAVTRVEIEKLPSPGKSVTET
jgi:hypothetical protein